MRSKTYNDKPEVLPLGDAGIRRAILDESASLTFGQRQDQYGDFRNNMMLQGKIMRLLKDNGMNRYSDAHNTALSYAVGKIVRAATGKLHRDNYVDAINYLAAAFEAESIHRQMVDIPEVDDASLDALFGAEGGQGDGA